LSPIIDIQRRMVEVGRIRSGTKNERGLPTKLTTWRLTSRDRQRLESAAELYGGEVVPWEERDGEFELVTTKDVLPILLLPGQALSQWFELWGKRSRAKKAPVECLRRCDGRTEVLSDRPCLCKEEATDDQDRECKPTTRLSVMLPDLAGIGHWRLESRGWNAAVELAGSTALLENLMYRAGHPVPARLRLDQRRSVVDGDVAKYAVPVIDIDVTVSELVSSSNLLGLPAAENGLGHTPVSRPPMDPQTLDAGMSHVAGLADQPTATTKRAAAPMGKPIPTDATSDDPDLGPAIPAAAPDEPFEAEEAGDAREVISQEATTRDTSVISDRNRRQLFATAREHGLDTSTPEGTAELKAIIKEATGQESTKAITVQLFNAVLAGIQARPKVEA
jgi:hypothetical protein